MVYGFLLRAGHRQFFYKIRYSATYLYSGKFSEVCFKVCEKHFNLFLIELHTLKLRMLLKNEPVQLTFRLRFLNFVFQDQLHFYLSFNLKILLKISF